MQGMTMADMDGDGDLDLQAYNATTVYTRFQEDSGLFTARPNYSASISGSGLNNLFDYNGDGVRDLTTRDASNNITVHLQDATTTAYLDETALSIATQTEAEDVLSVLDNALETLSSRSAQLGAIQSRLEFAADHSLLTKENLSAALYGRPLCQ